MIVCSIDEDQHYSRDAVRKPPSFEAPLCTVAPQISRRSRLLMREARRRSTQKLRNCKARKSKTIRS